MKKILIVLCALVIGVQSAHADGCATNLIPTFTANQATKLCATFPISSVSTSSLLPDADNTLDLGSATFQWANLYLGTDLVFGAASAKIIPGATSLLLRNNADDATNLGITDAGVATVRAGLVVTSGNAVLTSGDLTVTSGTLNVPAAANLGLVAENGANTACDTTCTQGCIIGYDAGTSAFVACNSALADSCACAGAGS